jgi:hypothetical protein
MVDEQVRYFRLIIQYAPLSPIITPYPIRNRLDSMYRVYWEKTGILPCAYPASRQDPVRQDRAWMRNDGEAFLSFPVPAFVWQTTITHAPCIWLEAFDY